MAYFQRFQGFFLHNILVEIQWNSIFIEFHRIVSSYNSWRVKLEFHERTTFAPKASRFSFYFLFSPLHVELRIIDRPIVLCHNYDFSSLSVFTYFLSMTFLHYRYALCLRQLSVYDYPLLMHASSHNVYWDTQTPASSPYARITGKKSSWFSIHTCDDHYH